MTLIDPNMHADPAKARRVIEFMQRPENAGMNNCQVARALGINEAYVRRAKVVFRWGMTMKISPKKLRRDGGTQSREAIDDAVVAEYVEAWQAGGAFPPVDAFYDGTDYWLADGFHRVIAAIQAGIKSIEVQSHPGTARDAILFSVGANAQHGLKRTPADKKHAILILLNDEEWHTWTNTQIAKRCAVDESYVRRLRPESHFGQSEVTERKTVNKHGQETTINTAKIGRKPKAPKLHAFDSEKTPEEAKEDDPALTWTMDDQREAEANDPWPDTPAPASPIEPTTNGHTPHDPDRFVTVIEAERPAVPWTPPSTQPADPPDIAAQRAKGLIPADAKVEVTEPAPADEDEPADVQAEQTDEEWLAECPAREKLAPTRRQRFDDAALTYRYTEEMRARWRRESNPVLGTFRSPGFPNTAASKFNWFFAWKHPRHWVVCGDCKGSGQVPMIGKCPACHGEGYHDR